VSHARITVVTSMIKNGARKIPGLLAVLALVPDPRRPQGRRYGLVFVLAVAAACTLAGAKTFREIGDQAADLPRNVLQDLGGRCHPLRRKVIARARPGSGRCSTSSTPGSSMTSLRAGGQPTRRCAPGSPLLSTATSSSPARTPGSAASWPTPSALPAARREH